MSCEDDERVDLSHYSSGVDILGYVCVSPLGLPTPMHHMLEYVQPHEQASTNEVR